MHTQLVPLNANSDAMSQLVHTVEDVQVRQPGIADPQVRHSLVMGSTKYPEEQLEHMTAEVQVKQLSIALPQVTHYEPERT